MKAQWLVGFLDLPEIMPDPKPGKALSVPHLLLIYSSSAHKSMASAFKSAKHL